MENSKFKKIILTGGGTGGSVVPLLGMADELIKSASDFSYDFLFIGTINGPEKDMVEQSHIKFTPISSGKFRRYFSWQNLMDIFKIKLGFFQAIKILFKYKPDLIISAGSFASVPVVWAGWLCRVPVLIHQQDVLPGLANKLMAPFAKKITVTFEKSLKDYGRKADWVGNILRREFIDYKVGKNEARIKYGFRIDLPVVLVMGGGTGARVINRLVSESANELIKFCQVVLLTGAGKDEEFNFPETNFKHFEFLNSEGMIKVFSAADIVVSRCGMGVLSELSYFHKPTILIPIPDSHQEKNAQVFKEETAAVVLNQNDLPPAKFVNEIRGLLGDKEELAKLSSNIGKIIKIDKEGAMPKIINDLLSK
jgi:UDP-N-acetylglucosamine--N-acetylmuramyl-(pentapeptide) pyrophosphoryl-undecaprenol N-acetylglucosamine transferase